MVRGDNYKPKEYYEKERNRLDKVLTLFHDKFELGEIKEFSRYYIAINNYLFQKIQIEYMLESDSTALKKMAEQYILQMRDYAGLPSVKLTYIDIIRALSLSVLFGVKSLDFIQDRMIGEKYVDAVCDLLRNKVFSDIALNTKSFYFQEKGYFGDEYIKSEGGLLQVINSNNQEDIKKALLDYVRTRKEKYHNRLLKHYDKIGEDRYTYTGSYDFVLSAVVKALGVKDVCIENNKFIACDLL